MGHDNSVPWTHLHGAVFLENKTENLEIVPYVCNPN
jgi:hypothetical protein